MLDLCFYFVISVDCGIKFSIDPISGLLCCLDILDGGG